MGVTHNHTTHISPVVDTNHAVVDTKYGLLVNDENHPTNQLRKYGLVHLLVLAEHIPDT